MSGQKLKGLSFFRERTIEESGESEKSSKGYVHGGNVLSFDEVFPGANRSLSFAGIPKEVHTVLVQLKEYFSGQRRAFSIPLSLEGPGFYQRVWKEMSRIPYGHVWTYSQLAEAAGSPKAARAVGTACAQNPIAIIIPCHRVVAKSGLGGYGGGLEAKKWLLALER